MTLSADRVIPSVAEIEACENYIKQTWRNRCRILTASGPEELLVPVIHSGAKMPIREVRIEYSTPWVLRTERAIESAYRSSPFFDEYRDGLFSLLESGTEHLYDLNLLLIRHLLRRLGLACEISDTADFTPPAGEDDDWRYVLTPKKPNSVLRELGLGKPYYQVFSSRFGFTDGLSILDLLFNEGPDSIRYLKLLRTASLR